MYKYSSWRQGAKLQPELAANATENWLFNVNNNAGRYWLTCKVSRSLKLFCIAIEENIFFGIIASNGDWIQLFN